MISLQVVIETVVLLIIGGVVFWLLDWALRSLAPPEPFNKVGRVVIILGAVLFVIAILMRLAGHPIVTW